MSTPFLGDSSVKIHTLNLALLGWAAISLLACNSAAGQSKGAALADETLRREAEVAMKLAATYFRQQVAAHSGYVYHYLPTLERRWGEGEATRDQVWVQPPGTPAVGLAYLAAYRATDDEYYLDAVRDVAQSLLYGQLKSGGWRNSIDFDPQGKLVADYRHLNASKKNNRSSLDDGQTQTAIQFLVLADEALQFSDPAIHEAAQYALASLLNAQFPNGAFPQGWIGPVVDGVAETEPKLAAGDAADAATVRASYPDYDWRSEGRVKEYWDLYTLNDDLAATIAPVFIEAHRIYQDPRCLDALKRLGDFLIAAQMPEPQPAWAQQYTYAMHPAWARKFEPPAISGSESQGVIRVLMDIYRITGDVKYLAPIEPALAYLERSQLPDGRLARFYELQTNKPLYMYREGDVYTLTYQDDRLPSHYGWKIASRVSRLLDEYRKLRNNEPSSGTGMEPGSVKQRSTPKKLSPSIEREVRSVLAALDDQHRWLLTVEDEKLVGQLRLAKGEQLISSQLFIDNMRVLAEYLEASR